VGSTGDTITNTGPCTITEDIDAPVFPGLSMTSTTPTTRSWPSTRCATGSCRS
jgi:hypothetical protein